MYAEIKDGNITKIVRPGGSYKNISFGKLAQDQEYLDAGLYKLMEETPVTTEYQKLGGEIIAIDEASKTVTRTKEVLGISLEEIEAADKRKAQKARKEAMLAGAPYTLNNTVYQISFTSDDANGLMQVGKAFELGVTSTVVKFENGTTMPVTPAEFSDFAVWFVAERNRFFVN
ncbi:MAG TPA: hypothetical protein CFH81_08830 [Sulfurovum sp. UBA12169]|nr:MAG TPA: hypothetical protein CFH81_08830 [Sulfurovum sp. UBA12169]